MFACCQRQLRNQVASGGLLTAAVAWFTANTHSPGSRYPTSAHSIRVSTCPGRLSLDSAASCVLISLPSGLQVDSFEFAFIAFLPVGSVVSMGATSSSLSLPATSLAHLSLAADGGEGNWRRNGSGWGSADDQTENSCGCGPARPACLPPCRTGATQRALTRGSMPGTVAFAVSTPTQVGICAATYPKMPKRWRT